MVDLSQSFKPLALPRPRGAHRYDVFSLKLGRRLTLYRRSALDVWLMIESDPGVRTFCEHPGVMTVNGQRCIADFWLRFVDHDGIVLCDPIAATGVLLNQPDFYCDALRVRRSTLLNGQPRVSGSATGSACCLLSSPRVDCWRLHCLMQSSGSSRHLSRCWR
jgi:hypothetical protein